MISSREIILLDLIDAVRDAYRGEFPSAEGLDLALERLFAFAQAMRETEQVPDPMPPGWNRPAPATCRDVYRTLIEAAARVQAGDSYEGTITWVMPTDEPELADADFGLVARYRVGNLDGQGGLRVFSP